MKASRVVLLALRYAGIIAYAVWVVQSLYGWFLQPLGLPAITYPHALGILAFVVALRPVVSVEEWEAKLSSQEPARWLLYMALLHAGGFLLLKIK